MSLVFSSKFQYSFLFSFWGMTIALLLQQNDLFLFFVAFLWLWLKYDQHQGITYLTHIIALFIPISLLWYFYHSTLNAWWLADDPALLQTIVQQGIFAHFYQSDIWRAVSPVNLTPWVIFSLGIDWHLFGLEPFGYYGHQLLSFSLVLLLAYLILNHFFSPIICSFVLSLFVVSVPSANVVQLLMTRHYLEGLGLSLFAFFCYVKAIQREHLAWLFLGSLFYLLATTAKEIYVPLVVILPFLPIGTWKQRGQKLIPFIVVAFIYVLWRAYMLKPSLLFSGYQEMIAPKLDWDRIVQLPNRMIEVLGWSSTWQWALLLLAFSIFLFLFFKNLNWTHRLFVLMTMAAVLLPILPVLSILDSRYLFLPYFIISIGLAYLLQKQSVFITLLLGLSLLAASVQAIKSSTVLFQQIELLTRNQLEGQLILKGKSSEGYLVQPAAATWYYNALQWLRVHILKLPPGLDVCYDLCVCPPKPKIYQYRQGQLISKPFSQPNCGRLTANLTIQLQVKPDHLQWQLGPYQQGQYYVSTRLQKPTQGQFYPVPRQNRYAISLSEPLYFAVKYISPAGWSTYSPPLMLDPSQKNAQGQIHFIWQRPNATP